MSSKGFIKIQEKVDILAWKEDSETRKWPEVIQTCYKKKFDAHFRRQTKALHPSDHVHLSRRRNGPN